VYFLALLSAVPRETFCFPNVIRKSIASKIFQRLFDRAFQKPRHRPCRVSTELCIDENASLLATCNAIVVLRLGRRKVAKRHVCESRSRDRFRRHNSFVLRQSAWQNNARGVRPSVRPSVRTYTHALDINLTVENRREKIPGRGGGRWQRVSAVLNL